MERNIYLGIISRDLGLNKIYVNSVLELIEDGATVPFIARYRKERTGSLNEVDIGHIKKSFEAIQKLLERKTYILNVIEQVGKLNPELKNKIENTWDSTLLEDIYLPYKRKKQTRAAKAIANGLEPLAKIIMAQNSTDLEGVARRYVSRNVANAEEALNGAIDIIASWINENSRNRDLVRNYYHRQAVISSTVVKTKKEEASKYKAYFDHSEKLNKCPSHRYLAMLRGQNEKLLRVKLEIDKEYLISKISTVTIHNPQSKSVGIIRRSVEEAFTRLLAPSIESEIHKFYKNKSDEEAIVVFSKNLKELLLAAPLVGKNILALDPGFRTGCKVALIDKQGRFTDSGTIYPHPPQNNKSEAEAKVYDWISRYNIEAIAIGNGTAGKESYNWLKSLRGINGIGKYFVNENGASIYSASQEARDEFPSLDITVRGAISIGRRLQDPLSELVKIDAKSIGVGQYQHDVDQKMLKAQLDDAVMSCVNMVGVNLNTASMHILKYISGLGESLAKNVVAYREKNGRFESIQQLLKVPRLGRKAYEQCAGFLRIRDGINALDNTGVHPESYPIVSMIARDQEVELNDLLQNVELLGQISWKDYIDNTVGLPTLKDIKKELARPGLDPRGQAEELTFSAHINSIDDINIGQVLNGVVNNITKFGAFVDIGIKQSGLIHVSQIADKYISDPSEVLRLNQNVKVKILDIDNAKGRISLTLKF